MLKFNKWFASIVFAVMLMSATSRADEVATIVNESSMNIELYLKWSNLPNESAKIVLRPKEFRMAVGPSGARLDMRYNSTPGLTAPPAEVVLRVRTADVDAGRGYISTFRNRTPDVVILTGA